MDVQSNAHHLVLGKITDFLTGQVVADTHDERYRQKIVKHLVQNKGYEKSHIQSRLDIQVKAGDKKARIKADYLVSLFDQAVMLIKYAPGSLVTRRLSTLALSRVISPFQIPFAVMTNGEDAEILDGFSGCVLENGLENIPSRLTLEKTISRVSLKPIDSSLFDKASRIVYACEVDGACPCDSDVCEIKD